MREIRRVRPVAWTKYFRPLFHVKRLQWVANANLGNRSLMHFTAFISDNETKKTRLHYGFVSAHVKIDQVHLKSHLESGMRLLLALYSN